MANITDTQRTIRTIIACVITIVIWYILFGSFSHQVGGNFHNKVYVIVFSILCVLFALASLISIKIAENEAGNTSRIIIIAITIAILVWSGAWVAGSNEKVAPGSPQMEDTRL